MSVSISFIDESHLPKNISMEDSLESLLVGFQNDGVEGEHTAAKNTGGFAGGGAFNGTSYSYASSKVTHYAFVATGDLNYYFPTHSGPVVTGATPHTIWGDLDSITLSGGANAGHAVDPLITFTFDAPIHGDLLEGRTNDVHDIVWGLMNGHVDGFDDARAGVMSHGGLFGALVQNDMDISMSIADLVGHNFATETDLALAA